MSDPSLTLGMTVMLATFGGALGGVLGAMSFVRWILDRYGEEEDE